MSVGELEAFGAGGWAFPLLAKKALSTAPASDVTATSANALVGSALVGSPQKQLNLLK